jgi:hypothetical protein
MEGGRPQKKSLGFNRALKKTPRWGSVREPFPYMREALGSILSTSKQTNKKAKQKPLS